MATNKRILMLFVFGIFLFVSLAFVSAERLYPGGKCRCFASVFANGGTETINCTTQTNIYASGMSLCLPSGVGIFGYNSCKEGYQPVCQAQGGGIRVDGSTVNVCESCSNKSSGFTGDSCTCDPLPDFPGRLNCSDVANAFARSGGCTQIVEPEKGEYAINDTSVLDLGSYQFLYNELISPGQFSNTSMELITRLLEPDMLCNWETGFSSCVVCGNGYEWNEVDKDCMCSGCVAGGTIYNPGDVLCPNEDMAINCVRDDFGCNVWKDATFCGINHDVLDPEMWDYTYCNSTRGGCVECPNSVSNGVCDTNVEIPICNGADPDCSCASNNGGCGIGCRYPEDLDCPPPIDHIPTPACPLTKMVCDGVIVSGCSAYDPDAFCVANDGICCPHAGCTDTADCAKTNFSYDYGGNLLGVSKPAKGFSYDLFNRLSKVTLFNTFQIIDTEEYTYDTEGKRIKKVVNNSLGKNTTYYFYSGNDVIYTEETFQPPGCSCDFQGDINQDNKKDIADLVNTITEVSTGIQNQKDNSCPNVKNKADANCDNAVNATDVDFLINALFNAGLASCTTCATTPISPGAPTLSSAIASGNSISLTWTAPTTGATVSYYMVEWSRNNMFPKIIQTTNSNPSLVHAGLIAGTYNYTVRACNPSGGCGLPSNSLFATILAPSPSASINITQPIQGATINSNTHILATSSITSGLSVLTYIDYVLKNTDSLSPWDYLWDITNYANGEYAIRVDLRDANNLLATDSITVSVRNPDSITITTPANGTILSGESITFTATVTSSTPVEVNFSIDGGGKCLVFEPPWVCTRSISDFGVGSHPVVAQLIEISSGNILATSPTIFVIKPVPNVVRNPGFETIANAGKDIVNWSTEWGSAGTVDDSVYIANSGCYSGAYCAKTASAACFDPEHPGNTDSTWFPFTNVALEPETYYNISFWSKKGTGGVSTLVELTTRNLSYQGIYLTWCYYGLSSSSWEQFSCIGKTIKLSEVHPDFISSGKILYNLNPKAYGSGDPCTIFNYLDNVSVVSLGTSPPPTASQIPPDGERLVVVETPSVVAGTQTTTSTTQGNACADGTLINTCSVAKPEYCDSQLQLVNRCDLCSCDVNQQCQADGFCANMIKTQITSTKKAQIVANVVEGEGSSNFIDSIKNFFSNLFNQITGNAVETTGVSSIQIKAGQSYGDGTKSIDISYTSTLPVRGIQFMILYKGEVYNITNLVPIMDLKTTPARPNVFSTIILGLFDRDGTNNLGATLSQVNLLSVRTSSVSLYSNNFMIVNPVIIYSDLTQGTPTIDNTLPSGSYTGGGGMGKNKKSLGTPN